MRRALQAGLVALAVSTAPLAPALAVNPDEVLADPALEARAREIGKGLRCVVCRNQSIDDSNAGIARDMRLILRERLVAGDTDAEAVAFMVERYGSFILLDPPVTPATWLLWGGPALLLMLAAAGFARLWARGADAAEAPALDEAERARAREILDGRPGT
ncbi:MAG: cytochrome c-type biogenesis protein CcmH [Rhodobacteraceae bacterium]|nr:cytochrome c-type biogenesis protein CcmH [Paracoccaceae bacterium]